MDWELTEAQKLLAQSVRSFLENECPKSRVRAFEEDSKGYCPEMWKKWADLGWLGLIIPREYGGSGMTFQDLTIILEEMGRNILPSPFFCTVIEGVTAILEAGNHSQKMQLLPKIARGDAIFTLAMLENEGRYDPADIDTRATPVSKDFIVSGSKLFVEMGHVADTFICVVRTKETKRPENGISLLIIDAKTRGVEWEIIPTMGMDKLCEIRFHDVYVPRSNLLGPLHGGWPIAENILRKATIAKCAESIGGMQAALDLAVDYCKTRVQYDRPIGSFQALQHILADMWISTNTAKDFIHQVIWMESEGIPCLKEISMAKSYVNEAYKKVTERALALHGAIGTTREHDIGLYYRRAKTADIAFSGTDFHREKVAREIGLIS